MAAYFILRNNIGCLIFYHKITLLVTQLPMDTHSTRASDADGEDPDTAMATPLMNYRAVHCSMEILPPSFDEGTKDGFLLIGLGD